MHTVVLLHYVFQSTFCIWCHIVNISLNVCYVNIYNCNNYKTFSYFVVNKNSCTVSNRLLLILSFKHISDLL